MGWPEQLAEALGEPALTADEVGTLLDVARDVAHGTERRYAPLSTFLLGIALGRRDAGDRTVELERLAADVDRLLRDRDG